jgi:hypothetical protein
MGRCPTHAIYGDLFKKFVDEAEDKAGKNDLVAQGSADNDGSGLMMCIDRLKSPAYRRAAVF